MAARTWKTRMLYAGFVKRQEVSDEWRVASGEWRVASGEFPLVSLSPCPLVSLSLVPQLPSLPRYSFIPHYKDGDFLGCSRVYLSFGTFAETGVDAGYVRYQR